MEPIEHGPYWYQLPKGRAVGITRIEGLSTRFQIKLMNGGTHVHVWETDEADAVYVEAAAECSERYGMAFEETYCSLRKGAGLPAVGPLA